MTDADKIMNPQQIGSDWVNICIRIRIIRIWIRINPEILIRIPDHFWLRLDVLAEVCALWTFHFVLSCAVYFSSCRLPHHQSMMSSAHSLCGRPTLFKTHLLHQFFECAIDCSYLPDCLYGPSNFFRIFFMLIGSQRRGRRAYRPTPCDGEHQETTWSHLWACGENVTQHSSSPSIATTGRDITR